MRYNLRELARGKRKPGTRVTLPPIQERLVGYRQYVKVLRAMLKALRNYAFDDLLRDYAADRMLRDAPTRTFRSFEELAAYLARVAAEAVQPILDLEAQVHTRNFIDVAKRTLGVDLSAVVSGEQIGDYIETAAARNASLIKSLSDDTVKRIQQAVLSNSLEGRAVSALRSQLVEEFGIADRRADLIARDQTAKLNSDLNRIRQTEAGIDSYEWSTSHDERVRPLHRQLDGRTYKWGEPTEAEGGAAPGQPVRCRCVSRGVVEF